MTIFFSLIIAMFVTMALIPPLMRSAERFQFIDAPNERKVHQGAIPRVGGIAMTLGTILPILLWLSMLKPVIALLLGFAVILFFGIWDDRKDLDYRLKFLGQFLAIFIVVIYGGVKISMVPFAGSEPVPDFISIPLTIFFILGITNAINLSDGLDGLAGGTTLIVLGIIAVMGYGAGDVVVVLVSLAIIGSILGFLRYNTHPARIFMGDSGSQFLGFAVAVMAVMLTQNPEVPISAALPILLLAIPIFDTFLVMGQRIYEGRSPFSADKNHIHHRLLEMGLDHYEAVASIYFMQSGVALMAYYMRYESDLAVISLFLVLGAVLLCGFCYARSVNFRLRHISDNNDSGRYLSNIQGVFSQDAKLKVRYFSLSLITGLVSIYFFFVALGVKEVAFDIGIICMLFAVLLLVLNINNFNKPLSWFERAGSYLICTYIVYLEYSSGSVLNEVEGLGLALLTLLAILIFLVLYCTSHKEFEITTHDLIVIFVAFVIPSLPGTVLSESNIGEVVTKLIILFYAIELIITFVNKRTKLLRIVGMSLFCLLGLQSIL